MTLDITARRRAVRRYRLIFRTSAMIGAFGLLLTVLGLVAALVATGSMYWSYGLLLASLSGLNAYKALTATVKIIELDEAEGVDSLGA